MTQAVGTSLLSCTSCMTVLLWAVLGRYVDLHTDPEWRGLLGGKRRVLMAKGAAMFSGSSPFMSISTNLLERLQELPVR